MKQNLKKYDAIKKNFRRKRKRRENCAKTELESPSNDPQFQQQIIQNDVKKNTEARYNTPGTYRGFQLGNDDMLVTVILGVGDSIQK